MIRAAFDGLIGLFLWPARLITCLLGDIIGLILGLTGEGLTITMEDILFNQVNNKVPILNVNFFEKVTTSTTGANAVNAIRDNISIWYTALRNLSIVLIAIIVIYVGLRMALATIAADQAKYKSMLIDWVKSLALLFVLHIIILLVINVNDALVKTIYGAVQSNSSQLSDLTSFLHSVGVDPIQSFSIGAGCAMGYLVLQILTFLFFITYVRRMVNIAFLITIAPLVTITYSIDKMKDGRSQAFDTWFKQFWTSVLIQPFQCIAYIVLGSTAVKVMVPNGTGGIFEPSATLSTMLVGIVMLGFILSAENIVRDIFGVKPNGIGRAAENLAMLTALTGVGKKAVSFGATAIKNSGAGRNVTTMLRNTAFGEYLQNHPYQREKLLSAGRTIVRANTIATGGFTGFAKGSATEKFGDEVLFALQGMESGHEVNKTYINAAATEHRLARAFNDYCYYDDDMTLAQAVDDCRRMLDGTITEEDLKRALDAAKATHNDNDIKIAQSAVDLFKQLKAARDPSIKDEGDRNDAVMEIVKKIKKGEIGEYMGDSATPLVGGFTPESMWGRAPKEGGTPPTPPLPGGHDDDPDAPHLHMEPTDTGFSREFEDRITAKLEEFIREAQRNRETIRNLQDLGDNISDAQSAELNRLQDQLHNLEEDINALNAPAMHKQVYDDLENQIEQVEREIQNGNNNLQSRLEELNAQRTAVGAEYDASAARVRQILDNHAGA